MKRLLKGLVLAISMAIAAPVNAVIVDNTDTAAPDFFSDVGSWTSSTHSPGFVGPNYQYAAAGDGSNTATWTFEISQAGEYDVAARYSASSNRAPDAPYTIRNNGDVLGVVPVDQRVNGGQYVSLGTFALTVGTLEVVLTNDASSFVIADAVELTQLTIDKSFAFAKLETKLDSVEGKIDALKGKADALEGKVDVLDDKAVSMEGKIDALKGKADALGGKVDVLDDKAVSMEGKIDALVADNTSEINALESKLAATEANLDAALRCVIGSPGFLNIGLTVFDCQTALEWEKKTDDNGIHDKDNVYSWSATGILFDGPAKTAFLDVLNDVAGGETNCFAGHCDWRLPKVNENSDFTAELETILDCSSFFAPCIDPIFGPVASVYWSATTAACCGDDLAWTRDFRDGERDPKPKAQAFHVRAVRNVQ